MKQLKHFCNSINLILILLVALSTGLFGQERLINESQSTFSELAFKESERLSKIQSKSMYTNYYLVDFKSLSEFQQNGKIKINLPDDDCKDLIYKAKSVKYQNEDDYVWYGVLESRAKKDDCLCKLGSITLISSKHGKIGHIIVDDKTYELLQLSNEKFVLAKLDGSRFTKSECGVNHETPVHSSGSDKNVQQRSNGNCDVRCLVLFTQNALDAEGDLAAINNRVNLAIAQTNQALRNSDVDACQLRIVLAGVESSVFDETDDIFEDIDNFPATAAAQRDAAEADIVVLLTDGDYGGAFGIVPIENVTTGIGEELAFAIVQTGAATTGRFTFAHEVGHLFGGGHENDPRDGIPHGHSFKTGNFLPCIFGSRQRTILHRAGADDVRIQHYSNPNVKFDGKKTGKEVTRENANQLRNQACVVAQFQNTLQPFAVILDADDFACPCEGTSLSTNIFNGTAGATYDYSWFSSIDGINWTSLSYTGSNAWVILPCIEGSGTFVRVDVTSSDGNTNSDFAYIEAAYNWPGHDLGCNMELIGGGSGSTISVAPNPSQAISQVTLQVLEKGQHTILIRNINGKSVENIIDNVELEVGSYSFPLNLQHKGLFFIHSTDDKGNQSTAKFLKL